MPLGSTAFWAAILPVEKTNLITNPSFERGTSGWSAYGPAGSATVGTSATYQTFGAWAGSIATQSTSGTAGVRSPSFTASLGSNYTVSAYVRGVSAVPYILGVGDSSGNNLIGSVAFTNSGTWQRYSYSFTEAAGATRAVVVRKTADPTGQANAFYVDAAQVEEGSITTYLDGDQEGCVWNAAPHLSTSTRDGQSRAGGTVVALADLGFAPNDQLGVGMMPLENSAQSYAIVDGAQYQRTRAGERPFTLTSYLAGTSLPHLHQLRRQVINTFKIDATNTQQPTRFWYIGALGTVQIDAVLDGGLEMAELDGFEETVGVKFIAYDPYWETTTQQGTALAPRVNLGSVNYMARRNKYGAWGTLGANGSAVQAPAGAAVVHALTFSRDLGTLFVGGEFGTVAGTIAPKVAMYYPASNTFGTLAGGTVVAGTVYALEQAPWGTLYIGGNVQSAGGTVSNGIAQWNGNFGTLSGGTLGASDCVEALRYYAGTVYIGGTVSSINGTTARFSAMYNGARGGTMVGGTVTAAVRAYNVALDGKIMVGGRFVAAAGTRAVGWALWNGTGWGTFAGGTLNNGNVIDMAVAPNGIMYAGGSFTQVNGNSAYGNIAANNGASYQALGSGVNDLVYSLLANDDGSLLIGGRFQTADNLGLTGGLALWNGNIILPYDIDLNNPQPGTVIAMAKGPDGSLYIGGRFLGTLNAAAVGTVVNYGMAQAYPTVTFTNPTGTAIRLYQLANTLTNDAIYFSASIPPFETARLTLTPGNRSFRTESGVNLFGGITPGSNLATWRLLPGTNYVSLFADSDSLRTSIYWSARHHSADAGTTY